MEQIITISIGEITVFSFLWFMMGVFFAGLLHPKKEIVYFTSCCCMHGFETEEECREYLTGA